MSSPRRARALQPTYWPLVARLVGCRLLLPLLSRALPLELTVRLLAQPSSKLHQDKSCVAIRLAGRLWRNADSPCLQRSLALFGELGRLGADVRLVCGVARERRELIGHAWVEVNGCAVLESDDPRSRYEALVAFDRTGLRSS